MIQARIPVLDGTSNPLVPFLDFMRASIIVSNRRSYRTASAVFIETFEIYILLE